MNKPNKNSHIFKLAVFAVAVALIGIVSIHYIRSGGEASVKETEQTAKEYVKLRVGWMTSWADAGRVVESLIHSDIGKRNGLDIKFKSFLFGPPMNEAALAGQLDVTIVGDMPALALLAASDDWSVVSKTLYFPYGLLVGKHVTATSVAGLKGLKIGVGFGTGPQPTLYRWLEEAGLDIKTDVTLVNIMPQEMAEAFKANRVDAIIIWEPILSLLESDFGGRVLRESVGVGFMCMRKEIIQKKPDAVYAFVESWREALLYASQHPEKTKAMYAQDSGVPESLLEKIRVADSNLSATSLDQVNIWLSEEDIAKNQRKTDFAFSQGLLKRKVVIADRVVQQRHTNE
uniref:ABC transporter substrate-binding protein n=1 Tax=Candidatus Electronema sp. TaxID=2698783 RepID=UPI004057916A